MKFLFILLTILLSGCSINTKLIGKYASRYNPNTFQFNKDSTFLNEYKSGHALKYSKGKWEKSTNNEIVLNSDLKIINVLPKLAYTDSPNTNRSKLNIDLTIKHGLDLTNYRCYVYTNNHFLINKRCDSLSAIELKSQVNELYFIFSKEIPNSIQNTFPVTTEKVLLKKDLKRNIKIEVIFDDLFFTYHPFNNETVKVKNGSIEIFDIHVNKWETIPKVSNKANVFIYFK